MKSMFRLVFFGLFVTGWGLAALSLHVVRTPTAIGLIPKDRLGIEDTYVDTRNWKIADASAHPQVVSRLLATGQADLLRHVTGQEGDVLERQLSDAVKHSHNRVTTTASSSAIDFDRTSVAVKRIWELN